MNDDTIIERVRNAVDAQVADVGTIPPPLGEPTYASSPAPRRRWLLPAALAAAAMVVLGVLIVSRGGDDAADVDVPATTTVDQPTPSGLERWVLDLPGAALVGASEASTSSTAIGTSVYYVAEDGAWGAAIRTNGASALLTRSSWPSMQNLDAMLGYPITLYSDDDQQLLVASGDPPYIIETYGQLSAGSMASASRIVDGVVQVLDNGLSEVGRRSEADGGLPYSALTYRYNDETIVVTVLAHPGGLAGYLLDAGMAPGETRTDARGQRWMVFGNTAVNDAPTGDVVIITLDEGSELDLPGAGSTAIEVDEATYQSLIASVSATRSTTTVPVNEPIYQAVGTVIEVPGEGVKICLGGVDESAPPQCNGVPVDAASWNWPDGTFQEQTGTRWGEYVVRGTYDGSYFTATELPRMATSSDQRTIIKGSTATRCPEPEGGWHAAAAGTPVGSPGDSALAEVQLYLESQPDYGGMWIDDSITLPTDREARYVVNAMFTGDVDRHRAELDAIWPGALCVVETDTKTVDQLVAIQHKVSQLSGALGVLIDDPNGTVLAYFILVTPELQAQLDAEYGPGTVVTKSALTPVS
jgi:hypothetical protein